MSAAGQSEKVPQSGTTTGASLVAPADCRAVHPRKIFNVPVPASELQRFHVAMFLYPRLDPSGST
eukprot:249891-Chlamydomonas_euryale.AAC.2